MPLAARAANAWPALPGPAAGGGGATGGASARGGAAAPGETRERLTQELSLTPAQQQRLDAILSETRQAFAALRGQDLDDRAREARRKQIREELPDKIRALLTPEQQAKYAAMAAAPDGGGAGGVPGRVFVAGPDGKPKAVPLVIGVSDGSASEVLQGDLQPGQEVIVGQATQPRPGGTPTGGPRLRL